MVVVLKIPIAMLLGIVYWAWKSVPEEEGASDDGGNERPSLPLKPRGRGPHGDPKPNPPARIRAGSAREPISRD